MKGNISDSARVYNRGVLSPYVHVSTEVTHQQLNIVAAILRDSTKVQIKSTFYCVATLLYGSETWAVKADLMRRLESCCKRDFRGFLTSESRL